MPTKKPSNAKPSTLESAAKSARSAYVALLRGVNVGGTRKVPMADLRALAKRLGYRDVKTYIQSGNVVFTSDADREAIVTSLEAAIEKKFGFFVDVVVRSSADLRRYLAAQPFPDALAERPKMLVLGFAKKPVPNGAPEAIASYAKAGERIASLGDAIVIDYRDGIGNSKLSPAVLDRAVGSVVTGRNWHSVLALTELVEGLPRE